MKGLIKLCALLFLGAHLLCTGVNHLHAQSKNNNPDMRWWLNGGWGRGSGQTLAVIGSFNLQYKQFLFSARIASNTTDYAFWFPLVALFPTETETFTDYGLLLGLATRKKWFDASIATGVALMSYQHEVFGWLRHEIKKEVNDAQISLPVEAQAFFKPASFLGFGATLFGNINSEKSFGGLTFNLQLGKLR